MISYSKKYKPFLITGLLTLPLLLLITSAINHFFTPAYAYLTILCWSISTCVWFNIQIFTRKKLLGVLHAFVIIIAAVSYITYLLYNSTGIDEKTKTIYVNSNNSRLIFIAENLIYAAIYLAAILFLVDTILFLKKKR